ncbi:hypothetical protein G6713_08960 [Polynucleobacter paneuropaeus]|jgi:hypothetical protein|nr:hypothetical protein G6713_08960 [Polynucleobacter paneuropaeus]
MKTYPIAIELTAWVELGIHQYNITIDDKSTVSIKRSDDVLHTRDLNTMEVSNLIEAISRVEIPLLEYVSADSTIASSSYELIIESAHFSNEFNWEDVDLEGDNTGSLEPLRLLAQLIEKLGQLH